MVLECVNIVVTFAAGTECSYPEVFWGTTAKIAGSRSRIDAYEGLRGKCQNLVRVKKQTIRQMSTAPVTNPLISGEAKQGYDLDFRVYQDLKIAFHRELLKHVDLQKVATQPDDHTRREVHSVIQELASHLKTPLSNPENERLALAGRLCQRSRCCCRWRVSTTAPAV
jgi:hypothetical protein